MKNEIEILNKYSRFHVHNVQSKNNSIYLTVSTEDEQLVITLPNKTALNKLSHFTKKQAEFGVLRKDNEKLISKEMDARKCNWLLTDNNFNFVQCFTDKEYNPVCKDAKQSFLRDVEHWGVATKRVSMTDVKLLDDTVVKCLSNESTYFNQKVFLKDENSFVYLRKEDVKELYPSELMYLFHRNTLGELNLNIIVNNNWFYEE